MTDRRFSRSLPLISFVAACLASTASIAWAGQSPIPEEGEIIPCDTLDGAIPEGSMCRADPGQGLAWIVSLGPEVPPCERVEPPEGSLADSCKIVRTMESELGTSALISFQTTAGEERRLFVLPGGRRYDFPPGSDEPSHDG